LLIIPDGDARVHFPTENVCLLNMASLRVGHFSLGHSGRSVKLLSP